MGILVLIGILYFPPTFLFAEANHHIYNLGMLNGNSRPLPQLSETPFTSFNKGKKYDSFNKGSLNRMLTKWPITLFFLN